MKNFFLFLIVSFGLTACVTTNPQTDTLAAFEPFVSAGLISKEMAVGMTNEDMDNIQQLIANSASQSNESWRNKQTRDTYQFKSQNVFVNEQGQPCRTYSIEASMRGRSTQWQTTACRLDDGSWQAVNPVADNSA